MDSYAEHRARLDAVVAASHDYPADRFFGRGITICAGGETYFTNAYVCVRNLRALGCELPVQLWHLGPNEITDTMRRSVESLNVEFVDGTKIAETYPARILRGWEIKPYAIIHSRFEEVLALDADNVAVQNPEFLFETPEYCRAGAIFWPDYGRLAPARQIWQICGVEYRDEPEFESGQIVVDKQRCWKALQVTMHLNEWSDFYYQYVHGDKETFHMAWRKLNQEYAMPSRGIHSLPGTMCQHDFSGARLFQHRNMLKWKLRANNKTVPGFERENECLTYIADLQQMLEAAAPRRINIAPGTRWTAQYGEDRWLAANVELPQRGVFIEVGAAAGVANSNTYWLEQQGWSGLLIEADSRNITSLNRERRVPVMYCAAGAINGAIRFVQHPDVTLSGARRPESSGRLLLVPSRRLDAICRARDMTNIDVLSIDTEGTEIDVLEGLGTLRPTVIIVEFFTVDLADTRVELQRKLEEMGYRIVHETFCNYIAVLNQA